MKHDYWYGLPVTLIWGYVAMALFMTGDGFEMAFLSRHIVTLGFTPAQSSLVFTCYGLAAALAGWCSGVVAEQITPQRAMLAGFVLWAVMHTLFMTLGLGLRSYPLMLLFYGIRGLAYPLFIYGFMTLLVLVLPQERLAAASGWFWTMYSIGIGVAGGWLPSLFIPLVGETGTLWLALAWVAAGGLMALSGLRGIKTDRSLASLPARARFNELARAVSLLFTHRLLLCACLIRIINTLSLYGFAVIMPLLFVDRLGFTLPEWLRLWAVIFFITLPSNVLWGLASVRLGLMRQVRWFGCFGLACSSLLFYYLPLWGGHHFVLALIPALLFGICLAAFVPLTAVFPALEPEHKGAAVSVYNLAAGMSNFVAPAIASLLLPLCGIAGVVWAYTLLYLLAMLLTFLIRMPEEQRR